MDLYFIKEDGTTFKATLPNEPYFFVGVQAGAHRDVEDFLRFFFFFFSFFLFFSSFSLPLFFFFFSFVFFCFFVFVLCFCWDNI